MRLGRPQRQDGHLGRRVGLDVAVIQLGEEPGAHRDLDLVVGSSGTGSEGGPHRRIRATGRARRPDPVPLRGTAPVR